MSISEFGRSSRDYAGDVAVADQHDARPGLAHLGDQLLVAVAVEDAGHQVRHLALLGLGEFAQVLADGRVKIDHAVGQAAAHRDLVHVDVGRVEEVAVFGECDDGERARPTLGGQRGALQRIDGDVHRRSAGTDLLADIEHRRLIHLAFADHHGAGDGDLVERAAHGLDRRAVGLVLLAEADPAGGGECRGLGDAHEFEGEVAIGDVAGLWRVDGHGAFLRAVGWQESSRSRQGCPTERKGHRGAKATGATIRCCVRRGRHAWRMEPNS